MNKNKGSINVATLIYIIIIVILLGVVIYRNYLLKNAEQSSTISTPESQNHTLSTTETNVYTPVIENNKESESIYSKYNKFIQGRKNALLKLKGTDETVEGGKGTPIMTEWFEFSNYVDGEDQACIQLEYNGDLYIDLDEDTALAKKYGKTYKLTSNAVKAGTCQYGQDGTIMVWCLDEKGDIYYLLTYDALEKKELKLSKLKDVKYIVDIESILYGEGISLIATDVEGNMFKITEGVNF